MILILSYLTPFSQAVVNETEITIIDEGSQFTQISLHKDFLDGTKIVGINYCCTFESDRALHSQGSTSAVIGRMNGSEWLWSTHLTSNGDVAVVSIDIGSTGRIIIGGHYWGDDLNINGKNHEFKGEWDAFFVVLNPSGDILYSASFSSSKRDIVGSQSVQDDGGFALSGYLGGSVEIDISEMNHSAINYDREKMLLDSDNHSLQINIDSKDGLMLRYSPQMQLTFIRVIGGEGSDTTTSVIVNDVGNFVICGFFDNYLTLGEFTLGGGRTQDFFAAELTSDGEWVWAFSANGRANAGKGRARIVEIVDGYFAAWTFEGELTIRNTQFETNQSRGTDIAMTRLSLDGLVTNVDIVGGEENEYLKRMSVNIYGDVIVSLESQSQEIFVGTQRHTNPSSSGTLGLILLIQNGSTIKWAEAVSSDQDLWALDVSINNNGILSFSGYFTGLANFNGTEHHADSKNSYIWEFLLDSDSDSINDYHDNCPNVYNPGQENLDGNRTWVYGRKGDHLGDACDPDIDADLVENEQDSCPSGFSLFIYSHHNEGSDGPFQEPLFFNLREDYDSDGCMNVEDRDDDNDWVYDLDDDCKRGVIGWRPNGTNDYDWDGCRDADEDEDDDSDTILDVNDSCPYSPLGWISTPETDLDGDGCIDDWSTDDRDEDGFNDTIDFCPDEGGNSTKGSVLGCLDSDGDGWADIIDVEPEDPDVFLPPPPEVPVPVPPPEEEKEEPLEEPPTVDPLPLLTTEILIFGGVFLLVIIVFAMMSASAGHAALLQQEMRRRQTDDEIESLHDPPM